MSEPTVARLLFPRLDVDQFLEDQSYRDGQLALVDRGVGGFVVFSGTLTEVADAIGMLRESASQDLIFAADCEFGLAMRFGGANPFPRAMGLGNWGDADGIRRVSHAIAAEVLSVGIDWNLAPVVDINSNRGNPIVNVRSFGETTDVVSAASVAFIRGHNDAGVASCAKHFPGHGETTVDSHLRLPSVEADIDTMLSRELQPFRTAIDAGVSSIMTGHLASPLFDRSATPASLSGAAVSFLRNELAFDGVVVTDALDMGALDNGDSDEVVVRACAAGNDVLEIPANPATALDALETALQQGRIDPAAVADSVRRIDRLGRARGSSVRSSGARNASVDVDEILPWTFRRTGRRTGGTPGSVLVLAGHAEAVAAASVASMLTKFGFSPRSGSGSVFDRPGSELSGIELVITIVVPRGGSGRIAPADVAENVDFAEEWQLLTLGSPYIDDVLPTAAVPVFRIDTFGNSLSIINLALTELLIG